MSLEKPFRNAISVDWTPEERAEVSLRATVVSSLAHTGIMTMLVAGRQLNWSELRPTLQWRPELTAFDREPLLDDVRKEIEFLWAEGKTMAKPRKSINSTSRRSGGPRAQSR